VGSGLTDDQYKAAGARMLKAAAEVWERAEMIIKVKEPIESEYGFLRENLILYAYLHLAPDPNLTRVLVREKVIGIAYETIEPAGGGLPALKPMSEVAGRMAIQVAARSLEKENRGKGLLLGGVPGVRRGNVVILGAGVVGINATKIAVGMGAKVTVLDLDVNRLEYLEQIYPNQIDTLHSDPYTIAQSVRGADVVVGAVLIPGARAPQLVSEDLIKEMEPGSVAVDVAVDQGGCIATGRPTTHEEPTFVKHGVVHYCVANMPGAVAHTSTFALTNITLNYGIKIADLGVERAAEEDIAVFRGINVYKGKVVYKAVAESTGLSYEPLML
jgi:alanine dehydrogenase